MQGYEDGIEPWSAGARLETRHRAHCVVATVTGGVELSSVTALRDRLHGHVYAGVPELVLDLAGVTFLDSAGLSMLIGLRRIMAARGGTLRLAACPPSVAEVLELTGLTRSFEVYATVADAETAAGAAAETAAETAAGPESA
jgi:anti-sigma B factor antagonist